MSGLDIHYDLGGGHPLLGRRMPNLDLATENGPLMVFTLLHDARPVLLNFGEPGASTSLHGRIAFSCRREICGCVAASGIRGDHGSLTAPAAVLIRPDGYVAWVGDSTQEGLADELATCFGAPSA